MCFADAALPHSDVVVCYLAAEKEAFIAESLLGVLTNSKIETGGGFGMNQGGIQTTSARLATLTEEKRKEVWLECETWREANTDYGRRCREEHALLLQGLPEKVKSNTQSRDNRLRALESESRS